MTEIGKMTAAAKNWKTQTKRASVRARVHEDGELHHNSQFTSQEEEEEECGEEVGLNYSHKWRLRVIKKAGGGGVEYDKNNQQCLGPAVYVKKLTTIIGGVG